MVADLARIIHREIPSGGAEAVADAVELAPYLNGFNSADKLCRDRPRKRGSMKIHSAILAAPERPALVQR